MGDSLLFAVFLSISLLPKCLESFLNPLSPEGAGLVFFS